MSAVHKALLRCTLIVIREAEPFCAVVVLVEKLIHPDALLPTDVGVVFGHEIIVCTRRFAARVSELVRFVESRLLALCLGQTLASAHEAAHCRAASSVCEAALFVGPVSVVRYLSLRNALVFIQAGFVFESVLIGTILRILIAGVRFLVWLHRLSPALRFCQAFPVKNVAFPFCTF